MWRPRNLLLLLCTSLDWVTRVVGLIEVFGYEGGDVRVSCSYGSGYESYEKYLCKNDCTHEDILITTLENQRGKYSISDNHTARVFTVTIPRLSSSDALKYWCGVSRNGKDIYTEVRLQISPDFCCNDVVPVQSHEDVPVSISCPYDLKHKDRPKYICRGSRPSECLQQAAVTSGMTPRGRFQLTDNKTSGKFTVTIDRLTKGDTGQYLCGVNMNSGLDVFSAVRLEVQNWCCVTSRNVTGIVGQAVTLLCPYPPQHRDNRKFLCKGDHRNNCTDTVTPLGRFTLQDHVASSSFMVTVSPLEAGDAGTYWCGSDSQWRVGNYTRIQLSVSLQLTTDAISTFAAETATINSTDTFWELDKDTVLILVSSVVTALLILIVVIVACKCHKRRDSKVTASSRAHGKKTDQADFYTNKDVIMQARSSKQQSTCHYDHGYDYAGDDQPDYENLGAPEEIYCNESFHK